MQQARFERTLPDAAIGGTDERSRGILLSKVGRNERRARDNLIQLVGGRRGGTLRANPVIERSIGPQGIGLANKSIFVGTVASDQNRGIEAGSGRYVIAE
jgi:hypothetical protein